MTRLHAIVVSACTAIACAAAAQPEVVVDRAEVLVGDPVAVTVRGLEAGSLVVVGAERFSGRSNSWFRSQGVFRVDVDGEVDLIDDASIEAPWDAGDPTGPFWTMQSVGEQSTADSSRRPWRQIRFFVDADADGAADATADVMLVDGRDDLIEISAEDLSQGAFLMKPPGDAKLPVVIALGGSEGGDSAARGIAPRIASRGFAVLGLPYYSPRDREGEQKFPELSAAFAALPIDRLEAARDWLRARDDVDGERIGVWGVSKGGEFALAGASRIDGFSAIVAYVPSDVIWQGWGTGWGGPQPSSFGWRGEPLPFVPYLGMGEEFAKGSRGQPVKIRLPHDAGRLANPDRVEAARIRVEDIDEPVMVVGGDADEVWDSGHMVRNIAEAREAAGLVTLLIVDREAGHGLSGHAFTPLSEADARVRAEAFPAMIAFFREHLDDESAAMPGR
ncbi:MAG: acyl-CoA thioester hydrolase/BAAT C-terminal domain-containing protein [Planctomycetota bacterium]